MCVFTIEKSPGIISKTPVTLCGDAKTSTNSSCYQYSAKSASPLAASTFRTPFFCYFCTIRIYSFQLLLVPASTNVASETLGNGLESVSVVASTVEVTLFPRAHGWQPPNSRYLQIQSIGCPLHVPVPTGTCPHANIHKSI